MNRRGECCPACGSEAIVYFSSLMKKMCHDCREEWEWKLKENQKPLVVYQR